MASAKKTYLYKIYPSTSSQGTIYPTGRIATWSDEVLSEPRFTSTINGSPQECLIRLARAYDDFGEDNDVKLNNDVEVWCYDADSPQGTVVYRGFITRYKPVMDGKTEYVEVTLQSYAFKLGRGILEDTGGNTTITMNSYDPADMLKEIIDYHQAAGGVVNYSSTSVDSTGTTVSYTFTFYTYLEAIKKVIELCPDGWYWYIDATNTIFLKQESSGTDHNLIIGKHVARLEAETDMEDVVNQLYFVGGDPGGGQIFRYYDRDSSVSDYGALATKVSDQRVTLTATADVIADRVLNEQETPLLRYRIEVLDNNGANTEIGYNIENISPGDTLRIRNLKEGVKTYTKWDVAEWDVDVWDAVLAYALAEDSKVMKITYQPDKATIETAVALPTVSKRIEDYNRNLENDLFKDIPSVPTEV